MNALHKRSHVLHTLFEQQPCWMIAPLAGELGYSIPSVRRLLTVTGYYSSFTHNGKWYTLNSIPVFDREGLWFHRDIGFSRAESLTGTLVHLIGCSPAGMTAEQLGLKLQCRCHAILARLHREGRLQRQKAGRSHVYFAAETDIARGQRRVLTERSARLGPLPAEISVLVLAEFIRRPEASFQSLAEAVGRSSHIRISPLQIEKLFEEHGVKKTAAMPALRHGRH